MFNGKNHYKWPFSIAMLVYQRVVAVVLQVCFVGDSHRLATGGCSGKLCLWDLRRHTVEVEIPPYLDLNGAAKEENGEAASKLPAILSGDENGDGPMNKPGQNPSEFEVKKRVGFDPQALSQEL